MIFVCLGSQQFQFNRLLKELDRLVSAGAIGRDIFAQTGASDYRPKHYPFQNFLSQEEYSRMVQKADIVITHGGTGSIVQALKAGKQTIAVPRKASLGEHVDDHQFQIVDFMHENGYLYRVVEMEELENAIRMAETIKIDKVFHGEGTILSLVEDFIDSLP